MPLSLMLAVDIPSWFMTAESAASVEVDLKSAYRTTTMFEPSWLVESCHEPFSKSVACEAESLEIPRAYNIPASIVDTSEGSL